MELYVLTQFKTREPELGSHLYEIQYDAIYKYICLFPYEYWINCVYFERTWNLSFNLWSQHGCCCCLMAPIICASFKFNPNVDKKIARARDRQTVVWYIFMAIHVKLLCNPLTYTLFVLWVHTYARHSQTIYYNRAMPFQYIHASIYLC